MIVSRDASDTIINYRLGAIYLVAFWGRFHWSAYAILSGSLLNWKHRAELHAPV
jgi:hypothetical protein